MVGGTQKIYLPCARPAAAPKYQEMAPPNPSQSTAAPPPGIDEMVDGQGGLRPHWRQLLGRFSALRDGGLAEQSRRLNAAFEDEGMAGILPGGSRQVWHCDPLPLPLLASEFAAITTGLAQRADLLEAILADLYGPQTLLADGALPPAMVYPNERFLRAAHTDQPRAAGNRFMDFYAADLLRGPDGAWRVLADRSIGPAGAGYALENRLLLARVVPEVFHNAQIRPLQPFFEVWQTALHRLGQARTPHRPRVAASDVTATSPGIALLTPGPSFRHWFEHMLLSRELSCALVEGGDLTVRGGEVFLKTLKGLQPIDVLLNRVDPRQLDPLELGAGGGVPGLMDATRALSIHISNNPAAGLVEAPALAAWLPALAMRLLGERLTLDSVPTLWLGDPRSRALFERNPARWRLLHATDREAMAGDPAREPWRCAAAAPIAPSLVPCVGPGGMEPRPVVLRVYLVFDGQAWQALDGGFARIIAPAGPGTPERLTKDVWVLSADDDAVMGVPSLPTPPVAIRRTTGNLPSRVADNLFWFGRYVERLEGAARLARATIARVSRGDARPHEAMELAALFRSLVQARLIAPESVAFTGGSAALTALSASLRDNGGTIGSIGDLIASVGQLMESARDRLTGDMYSAFTTALRHIRQEANGLAAGAEALSRVMVEILRFSALVAGLAAENMVRGGGWLFLELGRRMERAQAICSQVGFALEQPPRRMEPALRLVLELCDSLITYRTRYLTALQPAPVLDLVLAEDGNPRGLAFQLSAIAGLLDGISEPGDNPLSGAVATLLADVQGMVAGVTAAADQAAAASLLPPRLHRHADDIAALSDRVTRHYFALLPAVRTLGTGRDGEIPSAAA